MDETTVRPIVALAKKNKKTLATAQSVPSVDEEMIARAKLIPDSALDSPFVTVSQEAFDRVRGAFADKDGPHGNTFRDVVAVWNKVRTGKRLATIAEAHTSPRFKQFCRSLIVSGIDEKRSVAFGFVEMIRRLTAKISDEPALGEKRNRPEAQDPVSKRASPSPDKENYLSVLSSERFGPSDDVPADEVVAVTAYSSFPPSPIVTSPVTFSGQSLDGHVVMTEVTPKTNVSLVQAWRGIHDIESYEREMVELESKATYFEDAIGKLYAQIYRLSSERDALQSSMVHRRSIFQDSMIRFQSSHEHNRFAVRELSYRYISLCSDMYVSSSHELLLVALDRQEISSRILGRLPPLVRGHFSRKHVNVTADSIEQVKRRIESVTPRASPLSPEPIRSPGLGKGYGPEWSKGCHVAWMHEMFDSDDCDMRRCEIDIDSLAKHETLVIVSEDALASVRQGVSDQFAMHRLARRLCLAHDTSVTMPYFRDAYALCLNDLSESGRPLLDAYVALAAFQTYRLKYWIKEGSILAILFA